MLEPFCGKRDYSKAGVFLQNSASIAPLIYNSDHAFNFIYSGEPSIVKDKIVVVVSVLIFSLILVLAAISSEWGMSLLSSVVGNVFHFSK